jgi:hypothetical protein
MDSYSLLDAISLWWHVYLYFYNLRHVSIAICFARLVNKDFPSPKILIWTPILSVNIMLSGPMKAPSNGESL